jgi:hypothetical protein
MYRSVGADLDELAYITVVVTVELARERVESESRLGVSLEAGIFSRQ